MLPACGTTASVRLLSVTEHTSRSAVDRSFNLMRVCKLRQGRPTGRVRLGLPTPWGVVGCSNLLSDFLSYRWSCFIRKKPKFLESPPGVGRDHVPEPDVRSDKAPAHPVINCLHVVRAALRASISSGSDQTAPANSFMPERFAQCSAIRRSLHVKS